MIAKSLENYASSAKVKVATKELEQTVQENAEKSNEANLSTPAAIVGASALLEGLGETALILGTKVLGFASLLTLPGDTRIDKSEEIITVVHPKSGEFPFDLHNQKEIGSQRNPKGDFKGGPGWIVGGAIAVSAAAKVTHDFIKNTEVSESATPVDNTYVAPAVAPLQPYDN